MALIVFPAAGYNSFLSEIEADLYFDERLNSGDYLNADIDVQIQALLTAFRAISELDITIDPGDAAELLALKAAQCEQALHELQASIDQPVNFLSIPGLQIKKPETPRFSDRALGLLRPYLKAPAVRRVR